MSRLTSAQRIRKWRDSDGLCLTILADLDETGPALATLTDGPVAVLVQRLDIPDEFLRPAIKRLIKDGFVQTITRAERLAVLAATPGHGKPPYQAQPEEEPTPLPLARVNSVIVANFRDQNFLRVLVILRALRPLPDHTWPHPRTTEINQLMPEALRFSQGANINPLLRKMERLGLVEQGFGSSRKHRNYLKALPLGLEELAAAEGEVEEEL